MTSDKALGELLDKPDSVELVEYELSQTLREQGVRPNVYPRLTAETKAKLSHLLNRERLEARIEELQRADNDLGVVIDKYYLKDRIADLKKQRDSL